VLLWHAYADRKFAYAGQGQAGQSKVAESVARAAGSSTSHVADDDMTAQQYLHCWTSMMLTLIAMIKY